jgi:FixJ family two-component response regulator
MEAQTGRPFVLVVDDDVAVARLLEESLQPTFRTRAVTSPAAALELLANEQVAIVLADQRMPGMDGLTLLTEVRHRQPTAVGVLITGHADVQGAIHAINSARVLGFLTKPWEERELLLVMQRALEAHQALLQLNRASQQPEYELRRYEAFSAGGSQVPVTARRFGAGPLREMLPDDFRDLTLRYAEILTQAIDQRTYKVDHHTGDALHDLADRLGAHGAGPRDVVDLHVAAIRQRLGEPGGEQGAALIDEGRLLVLELMGRMVTYYRNYTLGVRT